MVISSLCRAMKKINEKVVGLIILCGILLSFLGIYKCPLNLFLGISCPGCGMTRAYIALLNFDLMKAFEWYPLFPIPIIVVVYMFFRKKLVKLHKYELKMVVAISLWFIVTWVIRLLL